MKRFFFLLVLSFCLSITYYSFTEGQEYRTGLLIEDELPAWIKPSPHIPLISPTDDSCDNSAHLPPIGNQGGQGSCVGWAIAYYYKTYQEWEEHQWDVTDPAHQFSPAFVYNQINGGADQGSYFSDAFLVLTDMGCANLLDMPYDQYVYTSFPDGEVFTNAIPFRCDDVYYLALFYIGLTDLKNHLLNGHVAVYGIYCYDNFVNIHNFNNTYCISQVSGGNLGGHAVTFCGFDDSRVTADGTGAFKLANSWGPNWGENGFFWMSYEAVLDTVVSQGWASYTTDRIAYSPTLTTQLHLTHDDRYAIRSTIGIWTSGYPFWEKTFFDYYMEPQAAASFPETDIVLDLSDGYSSINPGGSNNLYMSCLDIRTNSITGEITYFSVSELNLQANSVSFDPPVAIPDSGYSEWAELILDPTALLEPPTNLTADLDSLTGVVTLNWQFSGMGEPFQLFFIYRDGYYIGNTSEISYVDTLSTYGTYSFTVTACYNEGESTPAGPVSVEYLIILEPPTNLSATLDSLTGQVTLNWDFSTSRPDFLCFRVFRDSVMVGASQDTFYVNQLSEYGTYVYNVTAWYLAGESEFSEPSTVEWYSTGVAEKVDSELPRQHALKSVHPNPFNPTTAISYQLKAHSFVKLVVYDIKGREVARLVDGYRSAGRHEITFNGSELSSGLYFARLQAEGFSQTKKMLLVK